MISREPTTRPRLASVVTSVTYALNAPSEAVAAKKDSMLSNRMAMKMPMAIGWNLAAKGKVP